jgi:hypothetical protein
MLTIASIPLIQNATPFVEENFKLVTCPRNTLEFFVGVVIMKQPEKFICNQKKGFDATMQ